MRSVLLLSPFCKWQNAGTEAGDLLCVLTARKDTEEAGVRHSHSLRCCCVGLEMYGFEKSSWKFDFSISDQNE